MPTPPGPEISPFTAQELDDFESDCVREDPAGVRMHRLCALARRGLEADKWKNAADLAFAGERARSAELDAAKREIAELNQRLYRLAGRALRHEHHAGATGQQATEWIDVVLDGPPGHESGRFVEVEDQHGHSISAGRWVPEGEFWRLRFTADDFKPRTVPHETAASHLMGVGVSTHTMNGPMGAGQDWAEVTRQLGERVARLEAERKLLERCRPVLEKALADLAKEPSAPNLDDLGPSELAAEMRRQASPPSAPSTFADIAKSPEFQRMMTENLMRDFVRTDKYLQQLLGPEEYEVMQRRVIAGGPRICDGAALKTAVGTLGRVAKAFGLESPSPDELVHAVETAVVERFEARALVDRVNALRETDLEEAAQTVDGLRAELLDARHQVSLADGVVEAGKKLIAKLKRDVEMAQHDREQAEQDAEAGSTLINRVQKTNHEVTGQRDAALAALASIAYMLHVDRGESVGQTRDRIVAKLDELLAPRPQGDAVLVEAGRLAAEAINEAVAKKMPAKHEDIARRIRESDHMRRSWSWSSDADPRDQDAWLATATDGDLLDTIFARLEGSDRTSAMLHEIDAMFRMEKLGDAQMIAGGTLKERAAATLAHARTEGRREADVERAGLVAKLALVREALGATLQPDGTDDVVDRARQLPRVADLAGTLAADEWRQWMLSLAESIGVSGDPSDAGGTFGKISMQFSMLEANLETEQKVHAHDRQLLAESNADHNALLTQLHRIREVFGIDVGMPWQTVADQTGKLQHDLAMARYDLEQATAQCDVLRGRQHEWFHVVEAITTRLGMTEVPGAPKEAREAIWSAIAKLQDASKPGLITAAVSAGPDPGRFAADLAAELGHRDVKLASGLAPFPELPVRPWGSIAEQILRDVIDSACACAAVPAVTFEIKHRRADADHPPRVELHVHRKGMESEPHVLAYVELGELWVIPLTGVGPYLRASDIDSWRWPERIQAALDRK